MWMDAWNLNKPKSLHPLNLFIKAYILNDFVLWWQKFEFQVPFELFCDFFLLDKYWFILPFTLLSFHLIHLKMKMFFPMTLALLWGNCHLLNSSLIKKSRNVKSRYCFIVIYNTTELFAGVSVLKINICTHYGCFRCPWTDIKNIILRRILTT